MISALDIITPFKTLQRVVDRMGWPARLTALGSVGLLATVLLSGCVPPSDAEFRLAGIAEAQACLQDASPIRPTASFARVQPDELGVFFQTDPRQASAGDSIYLQVYQPDKVRAQLGEAIELADPRALRDGDHTFDVPPVVRGVAYFARSCPQTPESFGLVGTVVFEELGETNGAQIRGELRDAQIISLRDDTVVASELNGEWDFQVDRTRPRQYFPNTPIGNPEGRLP